MHKRRSIGSDLQSVHMHSAQLHEQRLPKLSMLSLHVASCMSCALQTYVKHMYPRILYVREWHRDELRAALRAMDRYNVENLERLEKMLLIWGGVPRYGQFCWASVIPVTFIGPRAGRTLLAQN